MRKIKNIIIILTVIIFTSNYVSVIAAPSDSIQSEIDSNKEAMDKIEKEKDEIKEKKETEDSELDKLLGEIESKAEELSKAEKDVEVFQVKIDKMQAEIDNIQSSINSAEEEILEKEKMIVQKEEELVITQNMLGERVRSYYKMNVVTQYLYMILKSDGLSDLLSNIQSIYRIMSIDRELMNSIKQVQQELFVEKDSLDKRIAKDKIDKESIIGKQSEIFEAQKEFVVIKDAKQKQMDELIALESEKENIIASLTDEEIALQHEIGSLVSYNKQLQAELDAIFESINNSNNSGSGESSGSGGSESNNDATGEGFLRPTSGPVTEYYGPRTNPVTFEPGYHHGVDFGDPWYTPIKASKSGVVSYSGVISGYGNCVIIDHGGGVTTLYAHADSLNVSVGQAVTRGETIALVGSTGMSTGPHLHFEIRFDGQSVDPLSYVS